MSGGSVSFDKEQDTPKEIRWSAVGYEEGTFTNGWQVEQHGTMQAIEQGTQERCRLHML